jgi:hypothetical protein
MLANCQARYSGSRGTSAEARSSYRGSQSGSRTRFDIEFNSGSPVVLGALAKISNPSQTADPERRQSLTLSAL